MPDGMTISQQTDSKTTPRLLVFLLIALAVLIPVIQTVVGIRLTGKGFAQDGSFAVSALMQFKTEILEGNVLPRWSFDGNFGLGSPIFFFYPPVCYYLATALSFLVARPWEIYIEISSIVLAVASIATCTLWISRFASLRVALLAGALYALAPYISFVNPQMRMAFAEMTAAPLWPLAFLTIDATRGQPWKAAVIATILFAAMALVHIPTLVLFGGLLTAYAAFGSRNLADAARQVAAVVCGAGLGMALAGFYVVPAISLQADIPAHYLDFGYDWSLLTPTSFSGLTGKMHNAALVIPVLGAAILAFRGRFPGRSRPLLLPVLGTLIFMVFLITPLAEPLWHYLPPLRKVQYPTRLLPPISLLSAVAIACNLRNETRRTQRLVLALAACLGIALAAGAYLSADRDASAEQRQDAALAWWNSQVREYVPLPAGDLGWVEHRAEGGNYYEKAQALVSPCLAGVRFERRGNSASFPAANCLGQVRMPIFYFPGWTATADDQSLPVSADPQTGLLVVTLDRPAPAIILSREQLPVQRLGMFVSCAAAAVWLALLCWPLLQVRLRYARA